MRRPAVVIAIAAGVLAGLPGVAAAETTDGSSDHCVIVLGQLKPGQTESDVIARKCSDDPADLTHVGTLALTPLITFYQDSGWGGRSVQFSGSYGTCDSAGYKFSDLTWDSEGGRWVSSFRLHGFCNQARGFYNTDFWGYTSRWSGSQSYIGDGLNDHMYSLHIWRG